MSPNRSSLAKCEPLPRGRHNLDRETVRASQRARILAAMLELSSKQGYAATTVPQVVAAARVSRNAFYEFFADKEACFVAVCDEEAASFSATVLAAASDAPDWRSAVAIAIREVLKWWQARPQFARAFLIEIPTVGELAIKTRRTAFKPFEDLIAQASELARLVDPSIPPVRPHVPHLLISGITDLIGEEIRAGRGERLLDLADDLTYSVTTLVSGGR